MKSKGKESLKEILSRNPKEIKEIVVNVVGIGGTGDQAKGKERLKKKMKILLQKIIIKEF